MLQDVQTRPPTSKHLPTPMIYMHMYICMYTHIYICTYIYICIYEIRYGDKQPTTLSSIYMEKEYWLFSVLT